MHNFNVYCILSLGQERFTWMTRVYFKDAHGCIIMFDLTNKNSFQNTLKWKKDVDSKCMLPDGSPIPCMLLANKVKSVKSLNKSYLSDYKCVVTSQLCTVIVLYQWIVCRSNLCYFQYYMHLRCLLILIIKIIRSWSMNTIYLLIKCFIYILFKLNTHP